MGPRFFKRGNLWIIGGEEIVERVASMGPRFFKRGNVA